jgi:hypothetical protein
MMSAAKLVIAAVLGALALAAQTPVEVTGKLSGRVLVGGSGRLFILGPDGFVLWEHMAALTHDTWMFANGNILFADGKSVTEVTADHKVVFEYKSEDQRGGGAFACQRLDNGNTMIGENSTGRILEVDRAGKIVFQVQTSPFTAGNHHNMRMARKLTNGNYLVCHSGAHVVKEYTPGGKVVMEIKTPNLAFAAIRTAANTTMVSTLDHIYEYDAAGKVVWSFAGDEIPGVTIMNMTGMHLLPGGNVAVGCYSAYKGQDGTGLFEITRDRKLVWRYSNPKADKSMMAIQRLDADGKPLSGRCLR